MSVSKLTSKFKESKISNLSAKEDENQTERARPSALQDHSKFGTTKEEQRANNRWISRTKHIGDELTSPSVKLKSQRKKGIHELENTQFVIANEMHNTSMLKSVLHKGYWKYKPEHFAEQEDSIDSAKKSSKVSPI